MIGTITNVLTVAIGSAIGLLIQKRLSEKLKESIFKALGLFTMVLGVYMALKTNNFLVLVFSMLLGTITGELLKLEDRLTGLTDKFKKIYKIKNQHFTEGMVTGFMIFCIGSMTILGIMEEALNANSELLITKALMDGFSSMALASALGIGVLFSAIPLLIYQGSLTLLFLFLGQFLSQDAITEITATGGVIMVGLGFVLLDLTKIRLINMLPALVFCVVLIELIKYAGL